LNVNCGTNVKAAIEIKIQIDSQEVTANFISGDGPVDAIFSAINKLIPHNATLELYQLHGVTEGTDALATATVRLKANNQIFSANGSDTDVLVASALAYINCLDKLNH